ncbi:hypothetical protein Tco_1515337 [Tanacetum coccineum]
MDLQEKMKADVPKLTNKKQEWLLDKRARLHYDRYPAVIEGYSDANWISDIKDSRSTVDMCFTTMRAALLGSPSKQTVIAKVTDGIRI